MPPIPEPTRPRAPHRRPVRRAACAASAIALAALSACDLPEGDRSPSPPPLSEPDARPVPSRLFTTLDGSAATLTDFRGRVLVVNLWGTWCVPCRAELPELVELQDAYGEGNVVVLGIAVDSGEPEEIREFADGFGVDYPIWTLDMASAMEDFGAVGYPFTILVDREGTIVRRYYGPQTVETLSADIDPLLE